MLSPTNNVDPSSERPIGPGFDPTHRLASTSPVPGSRATTSFACESDEFEMLAKRWPRPGSFAMALACRGTVISSSPLIVLGGAAGGTTTPPDTFGPNNVIPTVLAVAKPVAEATRPVAAGKVGNDRE